MSSSRRFPLKAMVIRIGADDSRHWLRIHRRTVQRPASLRPVICRAARYRAAVGCDCRWHSAEPRGECAARPTEEASRSVHGHIAIAHGPGPHRRRRRRCSEGQCVLLCGQRHQRVLYIFEGAHDAILGPEQRFTLTSFRDVVDRLRAPRVEYRHGQEARHIGESRSA